MAEERGGLGAPGPVISLDGATVRYGDRAVWADMTLTLGPGEFLAVLGPNGAGKTTLLRVLLGLQALSSGTELVEGRPPKGGNARVGYIPQQRAFDRDLPIRGRDIVAFGADGQRPGLPFTGKRTRRMVDEAIRSVGATSYADAPIGLLSGGEQQRLRVAQALLGDPGVLLCDEPLVSLDISHQQGVMALIDERRRRAGTTVVFVTHDINPVLPFADKVLYLVDGRWALGVPDDVFTTERLSELYGTQVEVARICDRLVVIADGAGFTCQHTVDDARRRP
jgi:zinc/manganese transport system ATP-binding protein